MSAELRFADVSEGDSLPELTVEVTPTMVVLGALTLQQRPASGIWQDD